MSEEHSIRVLIVDDHSVVRRGLRALLATEPGIEVVAEAVDGEDAVSRAADSRPDVVVMDLVLPSMDGVEAIRRIKLRDPDARILVLTGFGSDDKLFPALKAGALGYLLKDASPEELVRAIRATARGLSSLNQQIARRLVAELANEGPDRPPSRDALTQREIEVLRLLARGMSNDDIGDRLHISDATVRTHVSNILFKLRLDNRTQAALYALKEGVASLNDIRST
ncbi:MAG TPA: response regulator transcription factor [Candidatus Polarisedimenticolaceae bacterium]|nr:response regulator transcription factor [Candidatus Polarisedimenticolaceae bacterium]